MTKDDWMSGIVNRLHVCDCVEFLRERVPDNAIDLTVTSPPYDTMRTYKGYKLNFEDLAVQLYRVTKPGGVVVWVRGDEVIDGSESGTSFYEALYFKNKAGFKIHDTMIFHKTGVNYPSKDRYWQIFEYMFVFSKGSPKTFNPIEDIEKKWAGSWGKTHVRQKDGTLLARGLMNEGAASSGKSEGEGKYGFRKRDNVWVVTTGRKFGHKDDIAYKHPATFPESLAEDHILTWSNPGDIILDPMCGSGTTCKMAGLNKRKFIGIDISEEYIADATTRLHKYGLLK
jgi:DNA modification methylase